MPPRIQPSSRAIRSILRTKISRPHRSNYATAAALQSNTIPSDLPPPSKPLIRTHPVSQPPSHKPAQNRKTQLVRQYASILRSTPLTLIFQHNNLLASEWTSIRRELATALNRADAALTAATTPLASGIKLQVVTTGTFAAALRVVDFYTPEKQALDAAAGEATHAASRAAHTATNGKKRTHPLQPLLSGPLALLTFPAVSPAHLAAALSILAHKAPAFPAPTKRASPGWHEPTVQTGLQKLLLMGARIEGRVFDVDGTRWVGSLNGGLDGLRGQLVAMLQGVGGGITSTLESAAKSLYLTVEGRRMALDEEANPKSEAEEEVKA